MANIRVDSVIPISDGMNISFRSPADCSTITGLIVYYPNGDTTESKTFQFADAHGNSVGGKDLFASNVIVKVILDIERAKAYVQNADTNAYLEAELAKKYSPNNKPTLEDLGAAPSSHKHNANDITSGIFPIERGGTGGDTAKAAQYNIMTMSEITTEMTDASLIAQVYNDASTTKGTLFYRKASLLWTYIVGKIQSTFGFTASNVLPVANGGTGATTFTSGAALVGAGTGAVTTRTIRNNTTTSGAVTADTALITSNTLRYAINRTTSVAAADTSYTTLMARGMSLNNAETNPAVNGAIAWTYK